MPPIVWQLLIVCAVGLVQARPQTGQEEGKSVVYPRLARGRASHSPQIIVPVNGEDTLLRLEKCDSPVFDPNLVLSTKERGLPVHYMMDTESVEKQLYVDHQTNSVLYFNMEEGGRLKMEGFLGEELYIEPLGTALGLVDQVANVPHIISKIKLPVNLGLKREKYLKVPARYFKLDPNVTYSQRPVDEVRMDLMVVSDKAHNSNFGQHQDLLRYLGLLFASVNQRFASIKHFKIRTRVARVVRNTDDDMEPYVRRNRYSENSYFNGIKLFEDFAKFFENRKKQYKQYDSIVLLTGRDLAEHEESDDDDVTYDNSVSGYGYIGGACISEYKYAVAEETTGSFIHIRNVVHEIGHLLGSVHDGSPPMFEIPGHPGAHMCPFSDGYIMSYDTSTRNVAHFSNCSINQFKHVTGLPQATCLAPRQSVQGEAVAYDEVPQISHNHGFSKGCTSELERCRQYTGLFDVEPRILDQHPCTLYCMVRIPNTVRVRYWKLNLGDGIPCGEEKVCKDSTCVSLLAQ